MQIKTTMRYQLTMVRMAINKKSANNKCWSGCIEKETLLHCWCKCKSLQPLWKTIWRFLKNLKIELPCDPTIPLLGLYLEETLIWKDTCTLVFTAALFIIAKTWKEPKCLLTDEWIKNMWCICAMGYSVQFSSVAQSLSRVWLFATPWITACQASLSITSSRSLLKLMSIELIPSSHLILCHPFLLLPPIPPSIKVFSNESTLCMRWPKYWSFSPSISPSSEHPGLISFRMDWLELLAVQGTLKSLLRHHSSKASISQHSAFFTVQLSSIHDHWKNHSLDQTDLCWQSNVSAF